MIKSTESDGIDFKSFKQSPLKSVSLFDSLNFFRIILLTASWLLLQWKLLTVSIY